MERYTVSEVAARTGFSPSALRYYDERGLVPAPGRSAAGYRIYDDRSMERLAFVARAKRIGLGLDDITDLLRLWDDDECGPVQSRLSEMVDAKLAETRRGVTELSTFAGELTALRARLGRAPHAGPCDDHCACLVQPPVACTLDAEEVPARLEAWDAVVARADGGEAIEDGVRVVLPGDPELVGEVAALAAAEQHCCGFLTFALTLVDGHAILDVTAPIGGGEVVPELLRALAAAPVAGGPTPPQ
jgi:DNA-binding transcriptional MerR regulator